ncbi:MAG: hypothetical protein WD845_10205 [Pirellulales bacterium]
MQLHQHKTGSVVILPVRPMYHHRPHQAQRIHRQMPLATHDLFARIVAPFFPTFRRADRLAVDDCRCMRAAFTHAAPQSPAQGVVDLFPQAIDSPAPKHGVHGLPLGKVERQLPPLTTGADDIKDCVEDVPAIYRRSSSLRRLWQQRSNNLPLFVCQVAGIICIAHRYGSVFLDFKTKEAES